MTSPIGKGPHLDEDEIIRAVVDETDLREPSRFHLSSCSLCRGEKARLETQLAELGAIAEGLFEPSSLKRGFLVHEKQKRVISRKWAWGGLSAAAVSACLLMILLWGGMGQDSTPLQWDNARWSQEALRDEQLRAEVARLVENALPEIYLDISWEPDNGSSEELLEFLVPLPPDENLNVQMTKEVHYAA